MCSSRKKRMWSNYHVPPRHLPAPFPSSSKQQDGISNRTARSGSASNCKARRAEAPVPIFIRSLSGFIRKGPPAHGAMP